MAAALRSPDVISPHYQPIGSLPDGSVQGFEVLLRLAEPSLASVSIAECIAVAEHTGLIHELGRRMLEQAFAVLADEASPFPDLYLNVNVSVRQLMSRQFLDDVKALVATYPEVVPRICLEVTESQWLDPNGPAGDLLRDLRSLGLKLALDDFGTGHASLSYLQALPFDTVKIDRHFVSGVESDPRHRSICVALLAMARSCDMTAVAEGVETASQAALLADLGYDRAQGYLWAKPLPLRAAIDWLAAHR
jgi:cyclic di-GMP phosphodiesterase Gmr